jgi:hypothetical protein
MTAHPYRPVALAVLPQPARVEAAACQWCRWADAVGPHQCSHPVQGGQARPFCSRVNPRGECPHFSPSWLTRWMRALGLGRAPAMVDPRAWDAARKDAKAQRRRWTPPFEESDP